MKKSYDFEGGTRGALIPSGRGKTRITIRVDDDTLRWFRKKVHEAGGGSYQTSINNALREFISAHDNSIEDSFRRVLREELPRYIVSKTPNAIRRRKS
jgi:BrnA antitoxin of type II toxin-antitoxin system